MNEPSIFRKSTARSLQLCKRAHAAPEVIEREAAAHAVQHADEAARLIEVGDHRVLGDLEAHLRGIGAGGVEAIHHEFQELAVGQRLTGNVDADAAIGAAG